MSSSNQANRVPKEKEEQISRRAFWERLQVLAGSCRKELSTMEVSMYDGLFAKRLGYEKAAQVIGEALVQRRAADPMPSVGDLLRRAGAEGAQTVESRAELTANEIIAAVGEQGWNWPQKVKDFQLAMCQRIGPLGAEIVRRLGGWQAVCEAEGGTHVLRAQYMRLARAVLESGWSDASKVEQQLEASQEKPAAIKGAVDADVL